MRINAKLAMLVLLGVAIRGLLAHWYAKVSRALSQAQQDALASSSGFVYVNALPRGPPRLLRPLTTREHVIGRERGQTSQVTMSGLT